jgi:hypothetical protein
MFKLKLTCTFIIIILTDFYSYHKQMYYNRPTYMYNKLVFKLRPIKLFSKKKSIEFMIIILYTYYHSRTTIRGNITSSLP